MSPVNSRKFNTAPSVRSRDASKGPGSPQAHLADRFRSGRPQSISGEYAYEPSVDDENLEAGWETATLNGEREAIWAEKAGVRGARKKRRDAFKAPIYETYLKHAKDKDQDMIERWTETLNILLTFVSNHLNSPSILFLQLFSTGWFAICGHHRVCYHCGSQHQNLSC